MGIDLPAYLRRIGFHGTARADLATLRQIAFHHAVAIPFENLDPFRGERVSLEPADVQRKLVLEGRGGWCFEHNLLLGEALRALGFTVHDLAARVLWGREPAARTARTHRLLEVEAEGRRWLADAGFGGQTPTGVLDLDDRGVQQTPHEPFRLSGLEGDLLLEALPTGVLDPVASAAAWRPLYRFDRARQWPIDFEAANFQLARDPQSHFSTGIAVARPVQDGRWSLRNRELTWRGLDGRERRQVLGDTAALHRALREHFGIDAAGLPGLDERFAGLVQVP
jgi:N-hydroxyarylamine O-acetyltransferase